MTLPPAVDWREAGIGPGINVPRDRRVTRDNWRLYPYSRWAFQHTRELVPSRALSPSATPRTLPQRIVSLDDVTFADDDQRPICWSDFEEKTYCDAMLVLHHGAIIHESYRNGMRPETPHHGFSISKSFVGLLAEILIADGSLDAEAPATAYVPELSASAFAQATVRHLLDMTDGVAFDENYGNPDAQVHHYSANYWTPAAAQGGARNALTRMTDRAHLPGQGFAYRTPVADALAWMLVRATGQRLSDLFAARLWHSAGCADDGHFLLDVAGDEIAASGLNATARDLARLALLIIDGPTIPGAARASITGGGDRALFAASDYAERSSGSYRSQWWVAHDAVSSIAALGVFGQRLHIDMDTGLIIVRYGSHPLASNRHTDGLHRRAIEALRRHLA
jgi:CubicO group peptidase (beta-lactamase class C family)